MKQYSGFPFKHHSIMLKDTYRLNKFKQAIEKVVKDNDIVVDIGSGTGILSHIALQCGIKKVHAIEYLKASHDVAISIARKSNLKGINFINSKSYDVILEDKPTVLISETIGPIGIEENIIEIFFDFKKRHPSIQTFIPNSLILLARFFYSDTLHEQFLKLKEPYNIIGCSSFKTDHLHDIFEENYAMDFKISKLNDITPYSEPIIINSYQLGTSKKSDFSFILNKPLNANGLFIYFSCNLAKDIEITNDPFNYYSECHWQPYYIYVPSKSKKLEISYSSNSRKFSFMWSNF